MCGSGKLPFLSVGGRNLYFGVCRRFILLTTIKKWVTGVALIKQIALGLIIGIVIALFSSR